MQNSIGYSSFSNEAPFDPFLFVGIRKRLGASQINEINEKILQLNEVLTASNTNESERESKNEHDHQQPDQQQKETDLNLLNDGREKSEQLIDTPKLFLTIQLII